MGLYKRGSVWWVDLSYNGRRYRFSLKTKSKSEAERLYAEILLELKRKERQSLLSQSKIPTEKAELTFETFYKEHYLEWCKNRQATTTA